MASKLDQSLDTIISDNRATNTRRAGRGGKRTSNGPSNQSNNSSNKQQSSGPERRQRKRNDDTPYTRAGFTAPFDNSTAAHLAAANFAAMQQQLMQQQQQLAFQQKPKADKPAKSQASREDKPAKALPVKKIVGDTIHITNLAKDVTSDDVKEIFEKVGEIRNCSVNYNQAGQSLGTATVQFKQSADADRAIIDYDQAEVDGKPMYIKLVGTVSQAPVVVKKKKVEKANGKNDQAAKQAVKPVMPTMPFNAALMNPLAFGATFPSMQQSMFAAPAAFNAQQPTNRSQSARGQSNNQSNNRTNNQSNNRSQSTRGQSTRGQSTRGRGGRGGRSVSAQPSMADLDAELDSYHK